MNTHSRPSVHETEPPHAAAQRLTAGFAALDIDARLAAVRREIVGPVVFTTSFGLEDQAIAHAIFTQGLPIDVVTLDTGRLFPQTYEVWSETEARYGRRIRALYPERRAVEAFVAEHGIDGVRASVEARQTWCGARKVEPLRAAPAGA